MQVAAVDMQVTGLQGHAGAACEHVGACPLAGQNLPGHPRGGVHRQQPYQRMPTSNTSNN